MFIVDAHLDLSYNALRGRDVMAPAAQQRADSEGIPTVGLPDLAGGGVGLICATIFCAPALGDQPGYRDEQEAHAEGLRHLEWYRKQEGAGRMRLVRSAQELPDPNSTASSAAQAAIILLEGADPLRNGDDVGEFFAGGVRIVGLAWRQTRYAGGTGTPGPLTSDGVELVKTLDRFGIIHDASHLAEESFWQLLELSGGAVIASHSNCRSIVPTDRQLSDEMIRAIVARDGVIGINFYDRFLLRPDEYGKRRATLADVVHHMRHICDIAGDHDHVAIGTDMDGGLGRNEIPEEIQSSADLPRLADALARANFSSRAVEGIMGGNWLRYFRKHLA